MEFSELIKKRRSIRNYENREVPLEIITEIINDAVQAPSASNQQPWRFIIIRDADLMKRMSDESKANLLSEIERNPQHSSKRYEGVLRNPDFNVFYNAPCMVIIAGEKDCLSVYVDCALAACYLMFAAADRGLGSCWVNLGADIRSPALIGEIGLPPDCIIVAPIILGYPKQIPAQPKREAKILKIIQ